MNLRTKFYRSIIGVAAVTALLLLIPLIAMQFTDDMNWSPFDFFVAGFLLFGTGSAYIVVTNKAANLSYRAGVGLALAAGLFLIWANLAVGIIGSEDNPVNAVYFVVIFIGIIGAFISRFRPRGMAITMFVIATALTLIAVVVISFADTQSTNFTAANIMRYTGFHGFFITLFTVAGLLFRNAAEGKPTFYETSEE